MRSDYALYAVAIIFFIITLMVVFVELELKPLWIITTTVLGFLFIGLGYTQRPKPQAAPLPQTPTPTPTPEPAPAPSPTIETVQEEKKEITVEAAPLSMLPTSELTKVKGIGAKRSEQLKALGINTLEDLAKASAEDLASKLQISPKITGRWISEAKRLTEKY
ncbi:MAG: helix-hairpin-helix domain-containing protein [Candidatus Bathyarchaeia archaeon]